MADVEAFRVEVEAAVKAEMLRAGPGGFRKAAVLKPFIARGLPQSTGYRWIDALLATGAPAQAVARAVRDAAKARSTGELAAELAGHLPVATRVEHVIGTSTVRVIEELGAVVADLKSIVAHAKAPDGKPRNARLLMMASDRIRACLETAMKIHQAMRSDEQVDKMHSAMVAEVAKESPEVAERILRRMRDIAAAWEG
jgi:hypothetical protein